MKFKVGDIVEHPELGTGEVIKLYGIYKVIVNFDRYGFRKVQTFVDIETLTHYDIYKELDLCKPS
jgi:hypothetical protein